MAKAKPFNFAHFFGGPRAAEEDEEKSRKARKAKSRAEDDDRKDDAEDDDDDVDAEEDDRQDDAEDDDDDVDAEDDDDVDAEDDDDTDPEDDDGDNRKDDKTSRQARQAERRRCARIFGSKFAVNNVALAASLAFNTGMSSADAVDVLRSNRPQQPQGNGRRSLDERMQDAEQVRLGKDGTQKTGSNAGLATQMMGLYDSATGRGAAGGK
jgi:hypothetical protein